MKKIVIAAFLLLSSVYAKSEEGSENLKEREHSARDTIAQSIKHEEKDTDKIASETISAQIKALYLGYSPSEAPREYATALGMQLKYETAEFRGLHAAIEFSTAHDVDFATGEGVHHSSEIASEKGSYTELSQAYIGYKNGGMNIRAGRQLIDTPLADSDDIRIIANTFEAYTLTYEYDNLLFIAGLLTRWQGSDTGLRAENHWSDTGEKGSGFGGLSYSDDIMDISTWYYAVSKDEDKESVTGNVANNSFYTDISLHALLSNEYALHTSMQYLSQKEAHNSEVQAKIYGAMAEVVMFEDFALSAAYNISKKEQDKRSFCGFGGGVLYTNMDSMILDIITHDRDAHALVGGFTYQYGGLGFMYAYGSFEGKANSLGDKEHIIEQNIGFDYVSDEKVGIAVLYAKNEDKQREGGSNGGDWESVRVLFSYNF